MIANTAGDAMRILHPPILCLVACCILSQPVLAGWQMTSGPLGGYVRSLIADGQSVYAATGGGGILATDNDGDTWSFRNAGLSSHDLKSLATLGDTLFVASDENVFRSADQGMTWEACGTDLAGKYTKTLLVQDGLLFAGTYLYGVYRSSDRGDSWQAVNSNLPAQNIYWLAGDGDYLYAGTYLDGAFRSHDLGDTWTAINNGLDEPNIMTMIAFEGRLYASTLWSGVFVSENHGDEWTQLGTNLPSIKGFAILDDDLYAASFGSGVFKSTDSGQTWSNSSAGLAETNLWSIGTDGSRLFVGVTSGHIYRSSDQGDHWTLSYSDSFLSSIGSLAAGENKLVAGSHGAGLYTSINEGDSWVRATSVWTVEIRAVIAYGPLILAGTDLLGIFRSVDNGGVFNQSNSGLTSDWIQAFTFCGDRIFAGSRDGGVFLSTNAGISWAPRNGGLGSVNINALVSDGTLVFAGTADSGVFRTDDLGSSWMVVNGDLPTDNITAMLMKDGSLLAGTGGDGIYVSDDLGSSWLPGNLGLPPQASIRSLAANELYLFAGTNAGCVFFSSRAEVRWIQLGNVLSGNPVLSLLPSGDYLYAGISGGGVWRFQLSEVTGAGDDEGPGSGPCALGPNQPNPFDQNTTITLNLEAQGPLELAIFDARGRTVRTLFQGEGTAGEHRIQWDGKDDQGIPMPSGRYFCTLRAGRTQVSRGMLLLR